MSFPTITLPESVSRTGVNIDVCRDGTWEPRGDVEYPTECGECRGLVAINGCRPSYCPWCGNSPAGFTILCAGGASDAEEIER